MDADERQGRDEFAPPGAREMHHKLISSPSSTRRPLSSTRRIAGHRAVPVVHRRCWSGAEIRHRRRPACSSPAALRGCRTRLAIVDMFRWSAWHMPRGRDEDRSSVHGCAWRSADGRSRIRLIRPRIERDLDLERRAFRRAARDAHHPTVRLRTRADESKPGSLPARPLSIPVLISSRTAARCATRRSASPQGRQSHCCSRSVLLTRESTGAPFCSGSRFAGPPSDSKRESSSSLA